MATSISNMLLLPPIFHRACCCGDEVYRVNYYYCDFYLLEVLCTLNFPFLFDRLVIDFSSHYVSDLCCRGHCEIDFFFFNFKCKFIYDMFVLVAICFCWHLLYFLMFKGIYLLCELHLYLSSQSQSQTQILYLVHWINWIELNGIAKSFFSIF